MEPLKNWLDLIWRFCLFIYLPFFFVFYLLGIFDTYELYSLPMLTMMIYLIGIVLNFVSTYRTIQVKIELEEIPDLHNQLAAKRWKIIDDRLYRMKLKPAFDLPIRLMINSEVALIYVSGKATITGPGIYVRALERQLKGKRLLWTKRPLVLLRNSVLLAVIGISLLFPIGMNWEARALQRRVIAEPITLTETQNQQVGNSNENSQNDGYAVENEDYFFYVEANNKIVRTNHDFLEKETIVSTSNKGSFLRNLNSVGDWLYYSKDSGLYRIRFDGTDEEVVYDSSDMLEPRIVGNTIYFITEENDRNLYKIDLNEGYLEPLTESYVTGLAVIDDSLLVSHVAGTNGEFTVDQFGLASEKKQKTLFQEPARHLMKQGDDYYYLWSDSVLKKYTVEGAQSQRTLTEEQLRAFITAEDGIYYTYYLSPTEDTLAELHYMDFDGNEDKLLLEASYIEGLAHIGDSLLFTTAEEDGIYTTRRIDLKTGEMKELN